MSKFGPILAFFNLFRTYFGNFLDLNRILFHDFLDLKKHALLIRLPAQFHTYDLPFLNLFFFNLINLIQNYKIHNLHKNVHTRNRIIEFSINKTQFDISFVIIEQKTNQNLFPIINLNKERVEYIIEEFTQKLEILNLNKGLPENQEQIKEIKSQIYSLASYNSNKIMQQMVNLNDNMNKFQFIAKALKRWAKSKL